MDRYTDAEMQTLLIILNQSWNICCSTKNEGMSKKQQQHFKMFWHQTINCKHMSEHITCH